MSVRTVNLGDLTRIHTGKLDANASSADGDFPFFTCAREPLRINSYSYDCECVLVAGNGDLNTKYYNGKFDAYQRTYIIEVRPELQGQLHLRYVYHFLETYLVTLREQSIGGIIKYIKLGNLTGAKIPLPPLEEQKRIAGILDAADALRARRRESLAQLDTLLQSTFIEMFGDPVTNPMGWEVVAIENAPLHIGDGNYSSKYPKASDFVAQGVPFIRANNISINTLITSDLRFISEKQHADLKKGHLATGDVLITTRGDVGKVAIVPPEFAEANINAQLVLLRPINSSISSHFLCHLFTASKMRQKIKSLETGVALKQLPIRSLKKITIIIPPLELQHRFSAIVESVEQQKAAQRAHLDELDTLFACLQQRAFAGELVT